MIRQAPLRNSIKEKLKLKKLQTKAKFLIEPQSALATEDHDSCQPLEAFLENYQLLQEIGQGANGVVFKCEHRKTGKIYAVKKSKIEIECIPILKASFMHAKTLQHSAIIRHKGLYIKPQKRLSYMVMEFFEHPGLQMASLKDKEVAGVAYQLLEAVAYMHEQGVCHRDIKPENILYDQQSGLIKITDFGESKQIKSGRMVKQMLTCTGTFQYRAPELFRGGVYDELVDEWAAGVTIYELLTGRKPFDSEYTATIIENIENCRVSFEEEFWATHPGRWAKELIKQLLSTREKRITAAAALNSLWFEGHASSMRSISVKHEGHKGAAFESLINEKDKKPIIKKSSLNIPIIFSTEGNLIESEEDFVEDEQEMEDKLAKSTDNNPKSKLETASSECRSPTSKEDEELPKEGMDTSLGDHF